MKNILPLFPYIHTIMQFIFQLFGFDYEEYKRFVQTCASVTIGLSLFGLIVVLFVYGLSGYGDGRAVTPEFYGFIDQLFSWLAVVALVFLGLIFAGALGNTLKTVFVATAFPFCMGLLYFTHQEVKKQIAEGTLLHPTEQKK